MVRTDDADGYGTCSCPSFIRNFDPTLPILQQFINAEQKGGWACKHLKLLGHIKTVDVTRTGLFPEKTTPFEPDVISAIEALIGR